jgi:hypothetical protein
MPTKKVLSQKEKDQKALRERFEKATEESVTLTQQVIDNLAEVHVLLCELAAADRVIQENAFIRQGGGYTAKKEIVDLLEKYRASIQVPIQTVFGKINDAMKYIHQKNLSGHSKELPAVYGVDRQKEFRGGK